jgi:hypothetical protein
LRAVALVKAGSVNVRAEHEASGVHEQVPFPPREPLRPVVAAFRSSDAGPLDGLAVDYLVYTDGVDLLVDCEAVILGLDPPDASDRLLNLN